MMCIILSTYFKASQNSPTIVADAKSKAEMYMTMVRIPNCAVIEVVCGRTGPVW